MVRYRRGDGHYADVECAYAQLERYLVLSCNEYARCWKEKGHPNWGGLSLRRRGNNRACSSTDQGGGKRVQIAFQIGFNSSMADCALRFSEGWIVH
jgi:hypothetical protein